MYIYFMYICNKLSDARDSLVLVVDMMGVGGAITRN